MQATHDRRRISVFAGPPGIGKTTAVDVFCARQPNEVAIVKIARRNAKEVLVLQHALEAVRQISGTQRLAVPSSIWELRSYVFRAVCESAGLDVDATRRGEAVADDVGRLSIVFDEAQNLSREALEVLRFWNDHDRCYSPFPIGLIFVGNNEFSLAPDSFRLRASNWTSQTRCRCSNCAPGQSRASLLRNADLLNFRQDPGATARPLPLPITPDAREVA
jgi:DNA polymerase III delta prime subunit